MNAEATAAEGQAQGLVHVWSTPPGEAPRSDAATQSTAPAGRAATIGRLAGEVAILAAAGDIEGARAILEVIERLTAPAPSTTAGGDVVDLDAERRRRAGR